jgi:uncharacterized membrane protein YtjA (UPF0391 family)
VCTFPAGNVSTPDQARKFGIGPGPLHLDGQDQGVLQAEGANSATRGWRLCAFTCSKEAPVLRWAATFLVLALVAALFGFGGIAATSAEIAKLLFFVFLIVFAVTLIMGLASGKRPPVV